MEINKRKKNKDIKINLKKEAKTERTLKQNLEPKLNKIIRKAFRIRNYNGSLFSRPISPIFNLHGRSRLNNMNQMICFFFSYVYHNASLPLVVT